MGEEGMKFQAYNKILIEEQTVTNYVVEGIIMGYEFKIRYPSYRGTYLSCIEKLEIKIDEEPVNQRIIYFSLNGKQYLIDELKDQYKDYWNILDEATITILQKGGITKGIHMVSIEMCHRIPYAENNGKYLILSSAAARPLMAE